MSTNVFKIDNDLNVDIVGNDRPSFVDVLHLGHNLVVTVVRSLNSGHDLVVSVVASGSPGFDSQCWHQK